VRQALSAQTEAVRQALDQQSALVQQQAQLLRRTTVRVPAGGPGFAASTVDSFMVKRPSRTSCTWGMAVTATVVVVVAAMTFFRRRGACADRHDGDGGRDDRQLRLALMPFAATASMTWPHASGAKNCHPGLGAFMGRRSRGNGVPLPVSLPTTMRYERRVLRLLIATDPRISLCNGMRATKKAP
jgi:hypothetical protein